MFQALQLSKQIRRSKNSLIQYGLIFVPAP